MSDTPRTDAVYAAENLLPFGSIVVVPKGHPPCDPWELARTLERELAALKAQLAEKEEEVVLACYMAGEAIRLESKRANSAETNLAKCEKDARESLARFIIDHGFATGHGDTHADLLAELGWQIKELKGRMAK